MNFLLTFIGWALWTWIFFNITKDEYDDKEEVYTFGMYKNKNWESWVGSFLTAILLLIVGHMGLGLDLLRVIDEQHPPQWSDLYYAGSGVFYEAIIKIAKKVKGK